MTARKPVEILLFIYELLARLSLFSELDDELSHPLLVCLEVFWVELKMSLLRIGKGQRPKLVCQASSFLELENKEDRESFLSILSFSEPYWKKETTLEIPSLLSKFILDHFRLDFMNRVCPTFIFYFRFIYREINKPEIEWNLFDISSLLLENPFMNKSMKEEGLFFLGEFITECYEKNKMEAYSMALFKLAGYYECGIGGGIKSDKKMAFYYMKLSYESDPENEEAMLALAECFLWGIGTPVSIEKAIPLLEELSKEEFYCDKAIDYLNEIKK